MVAGKLQAAAKPAWRLHSHDAPLRAEPYSRERLEQHARHLAQTLAVIPGRPDERSFFERFAANADLLRAAYEIIAAAARNAESLSPDAEWLLDNFYVVQEQLREIRDDLPRPFYRELPANASGQPRVQAMAADLIAHTDSVLDEDTIIGFVREFQVVTPLTIGELWAIPIMLRLVLVENLRRIASHMLAARTCELEAARILAEWTEETGVSLDLSPPHECGSLILRMIEGLQELGSESTGRLRELERRIVAQHVTLQQVVHGEHQRQAANQVSIGNVITSMRLISALDWASFFERTSHVDRILRQDPANVYPQMDYESRDRYRHVIERIAKGSGAAEVAVAEAALQLAHDAPGGNPREQHIGYWLVDAGLRQLEGKFNFRPTGRYGLERWMRRRPNVTYLGSIGLFTMLAIALGTVLLTMHGAPWPWILLTLAVAVLPATEFAVSLVNLLVTSRLPPRLLPKLDFHEGIPVENRTVVVMPSMLTGAAEVESLLGRLEMHYLANPDPALSFALLTDCNDAPQAEMPNDQKLIDQARQGIRELNDKHGDAGHRPFYLFHRARRWNESQLAWMGWERKRAKLMEFHKLLRGDSDTSYVVQEGEIARLRGAGGAEPIRFVITLDSDTRLPHGVAKRLVGTLAHPLNRPVFDASSRRVTAGYVLLQPRVSVHLTSANRSRFARLFANNPGLDPYATCASDVYQDLYGEGSFTGKGIYDLETFEAALGDAFPENQILSHDLIEGCHTRVGLVSDIELFDNHPPKYEADARRLHRWVRGDWQILPWLMPRVPSARGWRRNPLSLLSRWKIFDNLRRSLVAPALMLLLFIGWIAWPPLALWFTYAGLLVLGFPLLAQFVLGLRGWRRDIQPLEHARVLAINFGRSTLQTVFLMAVLPHKAYLMLDAVVRTMWRMTISRRKLLDWETASDVERQMSASRWASLLHLWFVPLLAIAITVQLQPVALFAALPFALAWLIAPWLSHWSAQPVKAKGVSAVSTAQQARLRLEARRIWSFFEAHVGAEDHWLPPDNIQEYPAKKIAHRISPTNEGLFLVAGLVARDFGYLSLHDLTQLWERNLSYWERFERWHGHFYNWYDTVTLEPLFPRYVSTVDSGNLAACFLTLRQGIDELRSGPIFGAFLSQGLVDTAAMIRLDGERLPLAEQRRIEAAWRPLVAALEKLENPASSLPVEVSDVWTCTEHWLAAETEIASCLPALTAALSRSQPELLTKIEALVSWLRSLRDECQFLLPWFPLLAETATTGDYAGLAWENVLRILHGAHSLPGIGMLPATIGPSLAELHAHFSALPETTCAAALAWHGRLSTAITTAASAAAALDRRLARLSVRFEELALEMEFRFLFNPQRRLFSIGFNLQERKLDRSHYDMLCSEARLASYLAIAKGDVEVRHWFQLGRPLTQTAGEVALLSWGGTMFEYLMPPLFQHHYDGSLLQQSCRAAVARQQEYGRQCSVPWGISECAFGALAINSDYHYRSFGAPGLGLKRGLSKDLVISPYSTLLAVEIDPSGALQNLRDLERAGGLGHWGYYEAVDYTPERLPSNKESIIVRCYMSHHHGMSLIALGNVLHSGSTRRRFHANALVRATELLLQERIPVDMPKVQPHAVEGTASSKAARPAAEVVSRSIVGVTFDAPRTHMLSNGEYSVMLTSQGGGFSRCGDVAIARWRPDATFDGYGQFFYLRDVRSGHVWSPTFQPTCVAPDSYEVVFSIDKADFHRRDGDLETHLEVVVSPENNAEVRQLKITNHGESPRELELTSYLEVALIEQQADVSHPAFHKLFIETEYIAEEMALLARRRPRDSRQSPQWAVHVLAPASEAEPIEYDTSRPTFLGRNRTVQSPAALATQNPLGGTTGAVLDPIFALRQRVTIAPFKSVSVGFTTAYAKSREEALALADQYHEPRGVQRAFELAWAYAQVELRHLHISPAKVHVYQRLGSALLFPDAERRALEEVLLANRQGQRGLWRYGISGDLPILLVHVTAPEQTDLVKELLTAHAYLRGRGLRSDLVVLNDYPGSYFDALQDQLLGLLNEKQVGPGNKPAGIFLLRGAQLPLEDKLLLDAVAAIVLHGERGSLTRQLERATRAQASPPQQPAAMGQRPESVGHTATAVSPAAAVVPPETLEFWNGWGGFAYDGREYHIRIAAGNSTPLPWSNVVANERGGFLITESGGGYTWFCNSRENKLTTWSNDPLTDLPGEALYLRDDETGEVFSPFLGLGVGGGDTWAQHGQGYSRFLHTSHEIAQEVLVSLAPEDPVKFVVLRLQNKGPRHRRLSVTYFAEWVLGVSREETQLHVSTSLDSATGALLARNHYHPELSSQVAFLHVLGGPSSWTGDRTEFLARGGSRSRPGGLEQPRLSGRTGAGLDPCGAVQTLVSLAAGEEAMIVFLLGSGQDLAETKKLLNRYSTRRQVTEACQRTAAQWEKTLTAVQIKTPNRALDLLVNRWLLYQTLSCRVFGRSAFYQSGGAYGFRDQLQDVLAIVYSHPELARRHLLRAAARQFEEGDVQHWWHPPEGRGTRTRFSDDLLWLPFAVCHYLAITGDKGVLDESAPFLHSAPLDEHEQERYELPVVSQQRATLYEHCLAAIRRGFRLGPHGLPLMGCGDWNDGMNKVGEEGRGESVWVGWFILFLLKRFLPIMRARGDRERAEQLEVQAAALRHSLEEQAWDGGWYRRAYFDDGTPLGSVQNDECQIDSIAQSWSVLAEADPDRSRQALEAALQHLVRWDDALVLLFSPPFNTSALDPGYIKGYLPGIRENGGQYTHSALWLIEALTTQGDGDRALAIFDLINPIHHAATRAQAARYQVEPYVVAADVYGIPPHVGRGGWTWYTGSAAWMYRAALEFILGLRVQNGQVTFEPVIPANWPECQVWIRRDAKTLHFRVHPGGGDRARQETSRAPSESPAAGALTAVVLTADGELPGRTPAHSE
ncbi:MAG: GH36-type glycosyl hydrolase domain-containing protein [Pirellulaceae bacterium]